MAKKEKAETKTEAKVFGAGDLAEALSKEPFEVRAMLRRAEVEKVDGKYQWKGQKAFDAVVRQLKAGASKGEEAPKAKTKKAPETKVESAPETKGGKKDRVKPNAKRAAD